MKPYNIFNLNIHNGLKDHQIANGMDYLILLSVPTNANVTVKIDDINASEIPLRENYALVSKKVDKLYINCNAVENENIKLGQSDTVEDFQLITSPTINDIESINIINNVEKVKDFDNALLSKFDKIVNPYETAVLTPFWVHSNSRVTVLEKVLNCDKIIIDYIGAIFTADSNAQQNGNAIVYLDNEMIDTSGGYGGNAGTGKHHIELENIRGKTLKITHYSYSTDYDTMGTLQEFTLKL